MNVIPWYITVIRLIVPFSILRWQLGGILISMVVDVYDWQFVNVMSAEDTIVYQTWDKTLDLYYWLFIIWIILSTWKDAWAKKVAFGLFSYRIFGMGLFWLTDWRPLLFFFPNVFENFVIWFLILFLITKKQKLDLTSFQKIIMMTALIIPKLIHEYFQHFLGFQPWEIYNVGSWLGTTGLIQEYINYITWGGMLYIVPFIGFLFFNKNLLNKGFSLVKRELYKIIY